jgi:2-furoyl-CoA dehydrogenase large subunit
MGTVPQGQSHETIAAQVVASELGVPASIVYVQVGFDTDRAVHTNHSGTYASQFAVTGISAVHGAVEKLRAEILRLAAYALGKPVEGLSIGTRDEAGIVLAAEGGECISFAELSSLVNARTAGLPNHLADITLNCRHVYRAPFEVPDRERKFGNLTLTYAAQVHLVVVEIDPDTSDLKLLDYAAVDECGRVINHTIVRGQVQGAAAHGIGAALMEALRYDVDGNLMTATFSDYCPITILNMPSIRYENLECPSPFTYNGAKGMGEGGGTPLHAIAAALQDALGDSYVVCDSHHGPSEIFSAITGAAKGATVQLERR